MYARIIDGLVAETTKDMPELGPTECAHIVEVGPGVCVGWIWSPGGCVPPPEPDLYAVEPEYLDLGQVSIGQAERLYTAARAEAAATDADGKPGDGAATVLLELLGL